jgi:chromosome segregation protein
MDKGAHFYKCDFQVHTPRDRQWDGPNCVTEAERKAFSVSLVQAARAKGLQALAITDHHDLTFVRFIREATRSEQGVSPDRQLVIFPGVEITLGIPCQALLLFDADFPDSMFPSALAALGISPSADTEAKTAEVVKLSHFSSFTDLYARLNENQQFRGRFIVLPHVQDKGHQTLLRSGFDAHYKGMPCVGCYTDGPSHKLGAGNLRILSGKDDNYGNKKVAVIQTSDSRSISFLKLGSTPTWIKWAAPTVEGLRQACLSDRSRVSLSEPTFPKARILSVTVSDSVFLGPLELVLNPQYNAFIGGRGTGKSSALEYIRWGLCDQPVSVNEEQIGDIPNYAAKRDLLIAGTLRARDAVVVVECELNGVKHSIRRDSKSGKVEILVGEGEWSEATEQEVRDKFPIQAYSQKQLSSVGVLPTEIERLVTAEIAPKVDGIVTKLRLLADSIRQLWTQSQRKTTLSAEISREQSQLKSEKAQVEALRGQLKGLSPDDQMILAQAATYNQQQQALDDLLRVFGDLKRTIAAQKSEIDRLLNLLPDLDGLPHRATLENVSLMLKEDIGGISRFQNDVLSRLGDGAAIHKAIQQSANDVNLVQVEYNKKYEDAKARSTSHQSSLTELTRLEQSVSILGKSIQEKESLLKTLGEPDSELVDKWKEWVDLHRERSELIKKQCERLQILSGGAFRAQAKACGNTTPIKEAMTLCFAGKNIKKADEKIEALADAIVNCDDPIKMWFELANELDLLIKLRESKTMGDTPILEKALLSRPNRLSLQEGLTQEAILDLMLTVLEDNPQFEFRAGPDKYISFVQASSGQQATSLLKVLLNQDGPPLLIDQPEEDLDNEVIQEIATNIWDTKSKRQLLFVSHNANIVVNGDAELVVCFDYMDPTEATRGHVKTQGAIDIVAVKDAIKRVMEGGEKAFELRRQKYGF